MNAKTEISSGQMEGITILLVDDDADCRMLIQDAICQCKVSNRIFEVTNGQEALDFLHWRGKWGQCAAAGFDLSGYRDAGDQRSGGAEGDQGESGFAGYSGGDDDGGERREADGDGGQGRGEQLHDQTGECGAIS